MISIEQARPYSDMDIDKLQTVKNVLQLAPKGIFVEIGVRKGGTSLMALNADNCDYLISIDPYLPFNDMAGNQIEMDPVWYEDTKSLLETEAKKLDKRFTFFKKKSWEAIAMMKQIPLFAYVLLDGEHTDSTVQMELNFFIPRMQSGGVILVDNIDWLSIDFSGWEKPRFDQAYKIF